MKTGFRVCTPADTAELRRMYADMFYEVNSLSAAQLAEIDEEIELVLYGEDCGDIAVMALDEHGRPVGFAIGMPIEEPWARWKPLKRVAYLDQLYVIPSARGEGVGAALVAYVEAHYAAHGYTHMALDAVPGKLGYYQKMGYWHSARAYKFIG